MQRSGYTDDLSGHISPERYAENIRARLEQNKVFSMLLFIPRYILKHVFVFQRDDTECCYRQCWKLISDEDLDRHLNDVQYFRGLGFKAFWAWIRTNYYNSVPFVKKRGKTVLAERVAVFRLPAIQQPLCRNTFCMSLGILKDTLSFHKTPKPSAIERAVAHGNAGRPPPQALTPEEVDEVVNFLLDQSRQFAIPNPRYTFSRTEDDPKLRTDDVVNFFHFPAHLTKQSLYERFRKLCADDDTRTGRIISLSSFRRIIKTNDNLKHIRFDSHGTGACATCKAIRVRMIASLLPETRSRFMYARHWTCANV